LYSARHPPRPQPDRSTAGQEGEPVTRTGGKMEVQHIVVHYLIKNEKEQKAEIDLSRNLLKLDQMSLDLVEQLDASYRRKVITYAVFDEADGRVFPREFQKYIECVEPGAFLQFSRATAVDLARRIENISLAKGGFLVYARYRVNDRNYLAIYLIRDTTGMLFKKDETLAAYTINPIQHLDLDKLAMACRVDIGTYLAQNGRYLSFIKKNLSDISEYFINWVSATGRENNKIITKTFYDLINLAELPKDADGLEIPREEFRTRIHDYVMSVPAPVVNLRDLSKRFYADEEYLAKVAIKNNITPDTEFQADNIMMKKFIRIDLEADGLHLRFRRDAYPWKIHFDANNKNVVIIDSAKFAGELRKELMQNGAKANPGVPA
jgi:nucleoid-associated protein